MKEKMKELLPQPEDEERLKNFKTKITKIILKHWPNKEIKVYFYGSAVNGLWNHGSDVDVSILVDQPEKYKLNRMWNIAKVLRKEKMKNVIAIQNARMPICKFNEPETGIDCDLSINNRMPIHNSRLIYCYVHLDPRVRDIIMIVKKWSKIKNINDSKSGTFCS
ncbi:Nucleotidyltransferase, partial [Anaeromyces robustus]